MLASGISADKIVKQKGLEQVSDTDQIALIVEKVLDDHTTEVDDYLNGKETIIHWLFGQVMQAAKGKANPQVIKEILQKKLDQKRA